MPSPVFTKDVEALLFALGPSLLIETIRDVARDKHDVARAARDARRAEAWDLFEGRLARVVVPSVLEEEEVT